MELRRFELRTFCMPCRRATNCAITPIAGGLHHRCWLFCPASCVRSLQTLSPLSCGLSLRSGRRGVRTRKTVSPVLADQQSACSPTSLTFLVYCSRSPGGSNSYAVARNRISNLAPPPTLGWGLHLYCAEGTRFELAHGPGPSTALQAAAVAISRLAPPNALPCGSSAHPRT